MKNNKFLMLTAFLLTTAFVSADHKQEIHFKNNYHNNGKLQDIYLELTWRLRVAPHTKNTMHVTIPAGHTSTQKAPLLGYYLQNLKATPSGAMVAGAGFTGIANAGNNTYFEITSGKTPAGALNNKAEITGYKDNNAYNLAHGIVAAGVVAPVAQRVVVENNAPIVDRTVIRPAARPNVVVVDNQAPVVATVRTTKAEKRAARKAARNNVAPVVVENNAPIATRRTIVENNAPIVDRTVVRPVARPNVVVVDNNAPIADRAVVRRNVVVDNNAPVARRAIVNNNAQIATRRTIVENNSPDVVVVDDNNAGTVRRRRDLNN